MLSSMVKFRLHTRRIPTVSSRDEDSVIATSLFPTLTDWDDRNSFRPLHLEESGLTKTAGCHPRLPRSFPSLLQECFTTLLLTISSAFFLKTAGSHALRQEAFSGLAFPQLQAAGRCYALPSLSPFFSHSCALFCTYENLNSFLFKRFRTLCRKTPGVGYRFFRALGASWRSGLWALRTMALLGRFPARVVLG